MFDQYKIAVRVTMLDELSVPLAQVARHLATTEEAASKLHSRMASMRAYFAGGMGLLGAGATMAAPLLYAIDKAAQLQKQMIAVQIATRGTTDQMDAMRGVIEKVAGQTVFSIIDVSKMAKQIATGTGLGAEQVQSLLPAYAKYADVQQLMKDTPYTQSINDAIRAAHGAQHYDVASLTEYLNLLTKASLIVPGSVSEVVRALGYFQGIAKTALGVSDQDAVLSVALANRLGFAGTRGGTNLAAAFTRTIPGVFGSGLLTGKSNEALADMHMIDAHGHAKVFENGKFSVLKWMGLTSDFVAREFAGHPEAVARQNIMKDFQRAYGTNGGRMPAMMGSDQAITQWLQIAQQFKEYGGFEGMQQKFANEAVAQQYQNAVTNFQSAMAELGITLLPHVTVALKELNTHLGQVISWMSKNPGQVRQYAKDLAYFSTALASLGVISVATSAIIGLRTAIGALQAASVAGAAATSTAGIALNWVFKTLAAGALGYAAGTVIYDKAISGTKFDDWLGEKEAKLLAFFGNQTAKDAIAANRKGSAPHGQIQRLSPYIAAPVPNTTHVTVPIYLDSKKIAAPVAKIIANGVAKPQTGISGFDGSMSPAPAGGIGGL